MGRGLLIVSVLVGAACTPGEAERSPEAPTAQQQQQQPAVVEEDRSVGGLRLPVQGDEFSIGDERWIVEATTVEFPKESIQEDTQIIDVTIQARRTGTDPPDYLGVDGPSVRDPG